VVGMAAQRLPALRIVLAEAHCDIGVELLALEGKQELEELPAGQEVEAQTEE
jgi:hypothetical protein